MRRQNPSQATNIERFYAFSQASASVIGDAVDTKILKQDDERIELDITGCRFAQFFRELDEPELGFALLCSFDHTAVDELGKGDVELKRTRTIMQGGDHCDLRYALKKKGLV